MAAIQNLTELGEAIRKATLDQIGDINVETESDGIFPQDTSGNGSLNGHTTAQVATAINDLVNGSEDRVNVNAIILIAKNFVIISKPPDA